uniref:Zgc:92242 n=1 Tax=Cyprinus carpio carpio TaxID=630221 RepID=A0A8C1H675_CYPCA
MPMKHIETQRGRGRRQRRRGKEGGWEKECYDVTPVVCSNTKAAEKKTHIHTRTHAAACFTNTTPQHTSPASECPCKSVSWLLGSDGDVHVCIIGESDELRSPKLILSELRNKTAANPNTINRTKAEPVKSSLTKPSKAQQTSPEPGIQLLLKKPEELSDSMTVSDESKQDSGSDQSADDTRGQTDDSDSGSAEEDTSLYRSHMSNTESTVADRLREIQLHRAMKEHLSINNKTHPLDTPTPDKGVMKDKDSGLMYGSRVAQLRKNFNTSNAPCVKPPIPCKPAHLLASPSVR